MTISKSASTGTSPRSSKSTRSPPNQGVLTLLKEDHREVKKLFTAYQRLVDLEASTAQRRIAVQQICTLLTVHATVEEELFYPALRTGSEDAKDLLDEAEVEHASVKDLVTQLQDMDPTDFLYNAKVKVLGEYVNHHVKEEESELFPKAKKTELDLDELGIQVKNRKEELMGSGIQ
ncbi:hypothetical protein B9Z51_14335 [Limnohabitans sp. T6-5]|uniref:hemerythrin domain-containing protein n=1 Tax=Limnohabitans sp. T6-5 TaxID=1100724 RepID=UPI000D34D4ED|nr:hemerythrin domain-containing protein [Limnohabitans sp. T6-5]PUE07289.1 hypothetical protein B9Z51_14335 [Limnohabitans sp. T6-5]